MPPGRTIHHFPDLGFRDRRWACRWAPFASAVPGPRALGAEELWEEPSFLVETTIRIRYPGQSYTDGSPRGNSKTHKELTHPDDRVLSTMRSARARMQHQQRSRVWSPRLQEILCGAVAISSGHSAARGPRSTATGRPD